MRAFISYFCLLIYLISELAVDTGPWLGCDHQQRQRLNRSRPMYTE